MFMSEEDKITGGCLCGAIRYEADQAPIESGYCHCTMCQKSMGNLFGVYVRFDPAHFRFLSGELSWYDSSALARRSFCPTCGSPIAYQRDDVEVLGIFQGTLDHPEAFPPERHIWTDTKIPWVDIQSHLPDETTEMHSYKISRSTS